MLEFDPRVRRREAPVDPACRRIARRFPRADFRFQPSRIFHALPQALAHQDAELDLRGCPLGRLSQLPCFGVW
jgi:hypothetical protein